MDVIVKLTVSNRIYGFYRDAARNVAGSSAEEIMSDALSAYAGLISQEMAKELWRDGDFPGDTAG